MNAKENDKIDMTIAIHVIIVSKIEKIAYQLKEGKIILCAMIQRLKIKPTLGERTIVIIDTWKAFRWIISPLN